MKMHEEMILAIKRKIEEEKKVEKPSPSKRALHMFNAYMKHVDKPVARPSPKNKELLKNLKDAFQAEKIQVIKLKAEPSNRNKVLVAQKSPRQRPSSALLKN